MTNLNPNSMDLDWSPVIHQLSLATGLPDSDLRQGTLPYLQSIATPTELADALLNLLGSEPHALDLIQSFVQRRFPPAPTPNKQPTSVRGMSYAAASAPPPAPKPPRDPSPPAPASTRTADTNARKPPKKKSTPLTVAQFDALQRQGKLAPTGPDHPRVACNCQAQLHNLLTNCLTCGRIVCVGEGPGPCLTCSTPVLSSTQQLEALAQRITGHAPSSPSVEDEAMDPELTPLQQAQANQERLLEYDATSAQRTVVIDTKADYISYEGAGALWLSPAERERAAKLDRARRKVALHGSAPRTGEAVKLDLDLTRGALEQAKDVEDPVLKALAEEEEEEEAQALADEDQDGDDGLDDAYAWNMLENGRVVVKSRPAPKRPVAPDTKQDGTESGTGAYIHAGLAVRPVYIESKEPVQGAAEGVQPRASKPHKARRGAAPNKTQAHTESEEHEPVAVPGADSLAKPGAAGEGKRKRNRNKAGKVAVSSAPAAGPQEDDPGCG